MKKMNEILLLIVTLFANHLVSAQIDLTQESNDRVVYPDTLILEMDSRVKLTIAFFKMSDRQEYLSNELWGSILGSMTSAIESSDYFEGIMVSYKTMKKNDEEVAKIEVKPLSVASHTYLIGQEGITEKPADRIEFEIYQPKIAISFFVTDLEMIQEIKNLNIESVWDQINIKYKNDGKRAIYSGSGSIKYGNANIKSITSSGLGLDAIELSGGIGLGFIRDRFVPDFGLKVGIKIPDRLGNKKVEVGLLYTQHVFYEEQEERNYTWDSNGFLSGVYTHIFSGGYEMGLSAGTLLFRNGGYFKGDTYKFSLYTSGKESDLSLSPEVIVTDNFKQVIPVMRIGFSF